MNELEGKLRALEGSLAGKAVNIAFSGGLDSRFLAHMANRSGAQVRLVHVSGAHVPSVDSEWAREWAKAENLPLHILSVDVLEYEPVAANTPERCYHCKHLLFSRILKHLGEGLLFDGTNASDLSAFRPGLRAVRELGVVSPLAEAGLTKDDVRMAAARTGLDNPNQPSAACLLTRFAYGIRPDRETLERVSRAEAGLAEMLKEADCCREFRLRLVRPGAFELHLAIQAENGTCGQKQDMAKALALRVEAEGLGYPEICCLENLSGYYDRSSH